MGDRWPPRPQYPPRVIRDTPGPAGPGRVRPSAEPIRPGFPGTRTFPPPQPTKRAR